MTLNTLVKDEALAVRRAGDGREAARTARTATVRALQQLIEVLDGRRAAAHLQRWVAAEVVDEVSEGLKRLGSSPGGAEAGRLLRVHLQMRSPDRADYFGTMLRGSRVRAVAGRIAMTTQPSLGQPYGATAESRWMIVELTVV